MVDQRSTKKLPNNFRSRTFAYHSVVQCLSRILSATFSFIREHFDPVIKADQCAQNVDDKSIAANDSQQLPCNS